MNNITRGKPSLYVEGVVPVTFVALATFRPIDQGLIPCLSTVVYCCQICVLTEYKHIKHRH